MTDEDNRVPSKVDLDKFVHDNVEITQEQLDNCTVQDVSHNLFKRLESSFTCFKELTEDPKFIKFVSKDKKLSKVMREFYGHHKACLGLSMLIARKLLELYKKMREKAND